MIADMIRKAKTEQDVFSLLATYVEALGRSEKARYLPKGMVTLPNGVGGLTRRCLGLMGELDAASRRLDDQACLALREALHIFSNALNRLKSFERERYRSSDGHSPAQHE